MWLDETFCVSIYLYCDGVLVSLVKLILVTHCMFHQKLVMWYVFNPPTLFIHLKYTVVLKTTPNFEHVFTFWMIVAGCLNILYDLEKFTLCVCVCTHVYAHIRICTHLKCITTCECMKQYIISRSDFQPGWTNHRVQQKLCGWRQIQQLQT